VFYADAAAAHVATFPRRRDEYGPTIRAKLRRTALTVTAEDAAAGGEALGAWRARAAREPDVDRLSSPPVLGLDEAAGRRASTSSRCGWRCRANGARFPASWAGRRSPIGNLQLAGRGRRPSSSALALALERVGTRCGSVERCPARPAATHVSYPRRTTPR
jgi:hypothetical protein